MKSALICLAFVVTTFHLAAAEAGLRIRFGLTDESNTKWGGTISVQPGRVVSVDGWRFQQNDSVEGPAEWKASTRPLSKRRSNNPKKGGKSTKKGSAANLLSDNGIIATLEGITGDSVVTVKTAQGEFRFKLSEVPFGRVIEKLDGAVDIERVAASRPATSQRTDDDFPALAVSPDGTSHLAYVSFTPGLDRDERARTWSEEPKDFSFLATPAGGDQIWLRTRKGTEWGEPVAITPGKSDIYKCAVTIDGQNIVWVIWSERIKGDFEILACPVRNGKPGKPEVVSSSKANDISPVATADAKGRVWVAWQSNGPEGFHILARHREGSGWSDVQAVSMQKGNCWQPAIAAARDGRVAIAWDTYAKGDYDIWVREFGGGSTGARPVANTEQYEARPTLTYDLDDNLWIAWEESGQTWGKDWGAYERETGIGLYRNRHIGMAVLSGGKLLQPATDWTSALPGGKPRKKALNLPIRRPEPESTTRKAGEEAGQEPTTGYNNIARIVCDRDNRIWLFCRSREGSFHTPLGPVWMNYGLYYDGAQWVGPTLLPHSDNLIYNLPAVAAHPDGGVVVAHSSDHRQDRHVVRRGPGGNAALASDADPFDHDVYLSRLEFAGPHVKPQFRLVTTLPDPNAKPTADTLKERDEVARIRAYRSDVAGKNLRILRGEFHRHTEISGDGGNDGPLEDMWRYGIDAAAMDWIGNGDHDNGGGREYTWWLTQKTTDAFHVPGVFDPLFTYERSVRYPEGHRNVVFVQRGVRTLPRLPISARNFDGHAPDTQMLYKYLRHFDGVCASHTSATSMGTDWRDWDPVVEPMVEIYQGARQNYERPGAPRSPTANDAIGGWEPLGFVNLAFKKGYKFSFQSSSDHGSTHISYCLVYAGDASREAIHKAMKQRHTYGATDNIIADYRCTAGGKEHMMGDEFTTKEPPTLRLKLIGTAPFAKVTLIKDDVEVKVWEPGRAEVELKWTDPKPEPGRTSYYYFRGEQAKQGAETNGELVWVSPMWITFIGK